MMARRTAFILAMIFLSGLTCIAQEKAPARLILSVDESTEGPMGNQKGAACLMVYSDGKVHYTLWSNAWAVGVDKSTGQKVSTEHVASFEYHLSEADVWDLADFLQSDAVQQLAEKFGPPQGLFDYSERISILIADSKGQPKYLSTREYYVASLKEKSKYPPALIVLMDKMREIEEAAGTKGKQIQMPADCNKEY